MSLPNLILAGERRSGTTSLAQWLDAHPDIYLHPKIDMAYFVDSILVGRREWLDGDVDESVWRETHSIDEYSSLFEAAKVETIIGEKSADYLFWRPSHPRMKSFVPGAKIVLTLRNPTERAWSMYWNEIGKGREDLSFEEALAAEDDRCDSSAYARNHLSYRSRGLYDQSLKSLVEHFPLSQIKVVVLEEAMKDPKKTLKDIYRFLNVDPRQGLDFEPQRMARNWTTVPRGFWTRSALRKRAESAMYRGVQLACRLAFRDSARRKQLVVALSYPFRKTKRELQMEPETRRELDKFYKPHIDELEGMLNRDLSIWTKN